MDIARCGESLSRAATQGFEKGVCRFDDWVFARGGFSVAITGVGVELFLFETGDDIGTVHLNELEVSEEGFSYVGESVIVSRIESIVSEFVSCWHFKKNACVTDKGEQGCFTGSFKNPHPRPSSTSWRSLRCINSPFPRLPTVPTSLER
jgi:hypothetical protein